LFPVFRDREELPVSADLSSHVNKALAESRYLVVVCSPNAAKSLWVNEEIKFFKSLGREDRVLALIVGGEPHASDPSNECFPEVLGHHVSLDGSLLPARSEPIAGDAREGKDGKLNAKLKLLAGLLDIDFDALKQRENERRRRLLAGVTSSALLFAAAMSGVATYAVFQEREAKKQRKLALAQEHRATAARQSAEEILNYLLNQLSAKLEPIGHLDIVEDVQKQVETYYKNLGFSNRDLKAANNWATLLQQEGDRLLAQGDLNGARAKYQEKLEVALKLVKQAPNEAAWQRSLSVAYESLGDVLKAQGDLDAAKAQYQRELEIRRPLAEQDPTNSGRQRDLSVCYKRLGDVLKAQGDLSGARLQYERALEIPKVLVEKEPTNSIWLNDIFIGYVMLGDVSSAQGDFNRAKTEYQDSLDVIQKTVKLEPGNTRWQRDSAASYNRLGDALKALGDLNGAKVQYEKGFAITDRLAKQDPGNSGWQFDLFVSYDILGSLLLAQGNLSEAKAHGLNGRAIIEKLAKQDPGNTDWQ
jgi:eukaryotic-like serine/threonine-protein kinase